MKKGFTLIELLAVIVILAIIALIATPIILGIINDAREKANERSVELYAAAVKNGIAAYQLTGLNAPKSFSDLTIQYDGDVKCAVQELYADGSFYLEGCKVNNGEKEYSYGTKQELPIEVGKFSSVCKPSEGTEYNTTEGTKYNCKVDPNKDPYTFYVLNSTSTEVNLIMDSNINISGNAVKGEESDLGLVEWHADVYLNSFGPITAMNHLQTATSGWTNTNELTINTFTDETGATHNMTEYVVNARMPYYSEISNVSKTTLYLIDYLDGYSDSLDGITGRNGVSGVKGYWILSRRASNSYYAWNVGSLGRTGTGSIADGGFDYSGDIGVRPVITLDI